MSEIKAKYEQAVGQRADLRGAGAAWMEKGNAEESSSEESGQRGHRNLKKMNLLVKELNKEKEELGLV